MNAQPPCKLEPHAAASGAPASTRHFIDLWRFDRATLRAILDDAKARKAARLGWPKGRIDADAPAAGRTLAMIFEKNSTRTRFSFDAAIRQLGGDSVIATAADMQLGRGETVEDTAKVLARMVDAVMLRVNRHETLDRFAAADIPVINGLSDTGHPCQIIADLQTFEEHRGRLSGQTLAWIGDGNNVCASFIHAAAQLDFRLTIACPDAYAPDPADLARARAAGAVIEVTRDPREAARGAQAVMTDTWVSMGDADKDARLAALAPYQVDEALMALAAPDAVFLHCLPAHRGEEVTEAVIDGPQSVVFDEAENRIHAQKAVLAWCFGG
ncbi:MAG: ornithine carbamoyltransferase [Caulobacteraceae bacterium]|nr:ornithine carbamoyltransferase [Caulobacteraceae bacterium]